MEELIAEEEPITRERIVALRGELHGEGSRVSSSPAPKAAAAAAAVGASRVGRQGNGEPPAPTQQRTPALQVQLDGAKFELIVDHPPPDEGWVFVRPVDGGPRRVVIASRLKLLGFVLR